jgi:hypothetical protein
MRIKSPTNKYMEEVDAIVVPLGLRCCHLLEYEWTPNTLEKPISIDLSSISIEHIPSYVLNVIYKEAKARGVADLKRKHHALMSFTEDEEYEYGKIDE